MNSTSAPSYDLQMMSSALRAPCQAPMKSQSKPPLFWIPWELPDRDATRSRAPSCERRPRRSPGGLAWLRSGPGPENPETGIPHGAYMASMHNGGHLAPSLPLPLPSLTQTTQKNQAPPTWGWFLRLPFGGLQVRPVCKAALGAAALGSGLRGGRPGHACNSRERASHL